MLLVLHIKLKYVKNVLLVLQINYFSTSMRGNSYLEAATFWSWNEKNRHKTLWLGQAFLPTSPYRCCSNSKQIPTEHLCAYQMTVESLHNLQRETLFIRAFKIFGDDRIYCLTFWHGRDFKKYSILSTFLLSFSYAPEKISGSSNVYILRQSWKISCISADWILVALLDRPTQAY